MKLGRIAAVLAIVCAGAALCAVRAQGQRSAYKIGAVFDITGPASPLGTPERDTVLMIQEQVNKAGGLDGHPVQFIILDNGSEETKCVMAVKKLIEDEKVAAIIGPSQTGTTLAVASICEKAEIPLVSCAAGIKITQPVKPYVFKTAQPDTLAIAKVLDYLRQKKINKVAFINVSNAFGASGRQQMEIQGAKAGVDIVAKEEFGDKDTDMTAQLTRISARNPQAVICWGTNPGPAIVAKNMKQLRMKMPLIMSHGVANRKFIELAGPAANGVVFPAGKLIVAQYISDKDPQKRILLEYAAQFRKAFKREPDTFGGHAWDAAQLVLRAMDNVGDDSKKIRDQLENTRNFVGISGVFQFTKRDHNGLSKESFVMVEIKKGKWTLLK